MFLLSCIPVTSKLLQIKDEPLRASIDHFNDDTLNSSTNNGSSEFICDIYWPFFVLNWGIYSCWRCRLAQKHLVLWCQLVVRMVAGVDSVCLRVRVGAPHMGTLSYFVKWKRAIEQFITLYPLERHSRVHFRAFCPLEVLLRGYSIPFIHWERQSKGHFILFVPWTCTIEGTLVCSVQSRVHPGELYHNEKAC